MTHEKGNSQFAIHKGPARDMFHDVTDPSVTVGGRRGYIVPLSILAHALILAVLIVIPLMAVDALPVPRSVYTFLDAVPVAPTLPPVAPPRTTAATTPTVAVDNPG